MIQDSPPRIVRESDVLPLLEVDAFRRALVDGSSQGRVAMEAPASLAHAAPDLIASLGGEAAADWPHARDAAIDATALCLARDQLCFPAYGVLVDGEGRVLHAPAHEALHRWPDLACLPGGKAVAAAEGLPAASLFLPWGGTFNYGHFLLDALPSLVALDELGLLADYPPIAPPLKPWHRDLISLVLGRNPVREIAAPAVRLGAVAYATSMDHFLHAPNALLDRTRQRLLGHAPAPRAGGRRLYLSRRGQSMRVMVNEAALEAALVARAFEIVHPERLNVADQIQMMREAAVVVAATGAALANALFLPPGARVVEIQPETFTSRWVWNTCRQAGAVWRGYICRAPLPVSAVSWRHRLRRGFKFAYRLPLEDFLAFLDVQLEASP